MRNIYFVVSLGAVRAARMKRNICKGILNRLHLRTPGGEVTIPELRNKFHPCEPLSGVPKEFENEFVQVFANENSYVYHQPTHLMRVLKVAMMPEGEFPQS